MGIFRDIPKFAGIVRQQGLIKAVRMTQLAVRSRLMAIEDRKFDRKFGIETAEPKVLDELKVESPNRHHGFSYVPSPSIAIDTFISNLPSDLTTFSFVDFGSGKGRVLLLAARHPFRDVTGVEFSSTLHEIALRNLSRVPALSDPHRVRALNLDAVEFEIPDNPCVLYFHNPFSEAVFNRVMQNVEGSFRVSPRKIFVCYQQIRHEDNPTGNVAFLESLPFLKLHKTRYRSVLDRVLLGDHLLKMFETVSD